MGLTLRAWPFGHVQFRSSTRNVHPHHSEQSGIVRMQGRRALRSEAYIPSYATGMKGEA